MEVIKNEDKESYKYSQEVFLEDHGCAEKTE